MSRVEIGPPSYFSRVKVTLRCGGSTVEYDMMHYVDAIGLIFELQYYGLSNNSKGAERWLLTTLLKSGARRS